MLYHIHDENERKQAVRECLRVLKPNGIFILAYINRNAVFINNFKINPDAINEHLQVIINGKNGVFYASNFSEIEELADYFHLETIANVATDGLMYPLVDCINSLNDEQFESYLRYHFDVCEFPTIIGNSMHGLYFGRKVAAV